MHVHTLKHDIPRSSRVFCDECDIALRLATYDEAVYVQIMDAYADNGPMIGPLGVVVVPLNFTIFQEA